MMMETKDNTTTVLPPPANGKGATGQPASPDQATIPVAASAGSLILVLLALVLWYFLVRGQLRKKRFDHHRSSSHHSHRGSLQESNSRHGSLASSAHSPRNHNTPRTSPRNHRRSTNSSPRSKRNSRCMCQVEACTCPADSPLLKHSPNASQKAVTECTGMSPFCPHSAKFRLNKLDIHLRDSMDSDFHPDDENTPGPSKLYQNSKACTCNSDAVVLSMDGMVSSEGSLTNGESTRNCPRAGSCDVATVCYCAPVSETQMAKHCTCRVIHNPLDSKGHKAKHNVLNQSAPAFLASSSDSDFPPAEAL